MLFEILGGAVAGHLKDLALKPATDYLQAVLANEKAFEYAKKRVRPEFEEKIRPASYDHVVENLRLGRNDFIRYYQSVHGQPDSPLLGDYLRAQLRDNLQQWIYNTPDADTIDELISRFYEAYEGYYLTTDPTLATLHLIDISDEALRILNELREEVTTLAPPSHPEWRQYILFDDLLLFFTQMNILYEVVERSPNHIDIEVTEQGTLLPSKLYTSIFLTSPEVADVDDLLVRSRLRGHVVRPVIVSPEMPIANIHQYAEKRGLTSLTISDFRQMILNQGNQEHFVLGPSSSAKLAETYNIHEVYIEPDGLWIQPDQEVEYLPAEERTPISQLLDEFLSSNTDVLLVLGDYGSGKSAWCAHVTRQITFDHSPVVPVYIALRHLKDANDLPNAIQHAARLAKSFRRESHVLVIADGFDEMPNAMNPTEKRLNMLRLMESTSPGMKLIITARTSYFRGLHDLWHLFKTDDNAGLWTRMAQYIPTKKMLARVRAIMLHGFNNQQIDRYVQELARVQGRTKDFAEDFFRDLQNNDPHGLYRRLARNPLYLFLLVNVEPWKDTSVESIADVLELLIRYWLQRDIEKGQSRWFLQTQDRLEFMAYLAWEMHHHNKLLLTYDEFGAAVRAFYRIEEPNDDMLSVTLDLQTTGVFGSAGGTIYFLLPAVMDFFVGSQFARFPNSPPSDGRLPTVDQGRIWLALVETRKATFLSLKIDEQWYSERGVPFNQHRQRIALRPEGVLYSAQNSNYNWPYTNREDQKLISILNHVLYPPADALPNAIRVRMLNKYGLHARPVADIVKSYYAWKSEQSEEAAIYFRYEGRYVIAGSIMGMMSLAVERGAKFQIMFEGCSREEAESFVERIGGRKINEPEIDWEVQTELEP